MYEFTVFLPKMGRMRTYSTHNLPCSCSLSLFCQFGLSFLLSLSTSLHLQSFLFPSLFCSFGLSFLLSLYLFTSLKFHIYVSLSFPVSQLMFWLSPSHFAKSKTHFPPRWRFFASIRNTKGGK